MPVDVLLERTCLSQAQSLCKTSLGTHKTIGLAEQVHLELAERLFSAVQLNTMGSRQSQRVESLWE